MGPERCIEIPAYVLGLADGFRGSALISELAALGISAQHVVAVDASVMDPSQLASIYDSAAARWIERELVPAEAACAFGHLSMMREFLGTSSEWALFLEDDAILLRDPTTLLERLPSGLLEPTVVHLNADVPGGLEGTRIITTDTDRVWTVDAAPDRTVGYLANRALAQLATTAYEKHRVDSVADWPVRWRYEAQFAICQPPVIGHTGDDSSIETDRAVAQAQGVRGKRTQLARLIGTLLGPSLLVAKRHGYRMGLVFRLDVKVPVARVAARHLTSLRQRISRSG